MDGDSGVTGLDGGLMGGVGGLAGLLPMKLEGLNL